MDKEFIKQELTQDEKAFACIVAQKSLGLPTPIENLMMIDPKALEKHLLDEFDNNLSPEEIILAGEILMKLRSWYGRDTIGFYPDDPMDDDAERDMYYDNIQDDMLEDTIPYQFEVRTKIGDIYRAIEIVDYEPRIGLYKLITICKSDVKNGQDVIFGEFEDLIIKGNSFCVWFYPNTTYAVNHN